MGLEPMAAPCLDLHHPATVVAEVGDFHRFDNLRQLMAYLGLTPSEHSSANSVRGGGITKAGSGLARRALIEGAWSDRMQERVSPKLYARLEALPKAARDIAWKGQLRMCQRYRHLMAAGKARVVVTTAIAREMVGFIWAIARAVTASSNCNSAVQAEKRRRALILPMRKVGDGTRWGTLVACYEPTQSTLASQNEAAQDETTVMGVNQPADESLLNRRLGSVSYLAHLHRAAPGATGTLAAEQWLDSDHESRPLKQSARRNGFPLSLASLPGSRFFVRKASVSQEVFRRHAAGSRGNRARLLAAIVRMKRARTRPRPRQTVWAMPPTVLAQPRVLARPRVSSICLRCLIDRA
jgi:hypothetical protein